MSENLFNIYDQVYASKVDDRTSVHAPNHVPGQKPITIGHEYSVLAYLPDGTEERATLGGSVISQTGSI